MARQELEIEINALGLSLASTFVPWSQSRHYVPNAGPDRRSLNWRVTLQRASAHGTRPILSTSYTAGIAHAPFYKKHKPGTLRFSLYNEPGYVHETEYGAEYRGWLSGPVGPPILPDAVDVIWSLVQDADVLTYASFEEWARDYGYDTDSRKAYVVYVTCMGLALKLHAGIGVDGMARLKRAGEGY